MGRYPHVTTGLLVLSVVGISAVVDVVSGVFVRVDLLHVLPVTAAAWWFGRGSGIAAATLLTLVRPVLLVTHIWSAPQPAADVLVNAALGAFTMALAIVAVDQTKQRLAARAEVMILRGLLPICSFCKKIRTDANAWQRIEQYISEHSEAHFTHGICPACAKQHYGIDVDKDTEYTG
jgi:hypothetical protein